VFAAPYVIGKDGNRDGLPTVLLEAMALGTPCVSTDVTGIPELVRDGETGLIVPQHDAEKLAITLGKLLSDSDLRVKLSTQARNLIESEFDIYRNTAMLRDLFLTQRSQRCAGVPPVEATGVRRGAKEV
jgi:colanic acid/amylovoran biosynthesis glycosyltransferase